MSDHLRGRGFLGVSELPSISFYSMANQIFHEEGFRGFYRGYLAYMFAIVFWAAALPSTTDAMLNLYP